ncbi:MAG TPA: aminopeptidase, partial [Pedobacter sp.]
MKTLIAAFICLAGFTANAQDDFSAVFSKINSEVASNSKAYSTLKEATTTIGHRLTGSANGAKAEAYA